MITLKNDVKCYKNVNNNTLPEERIDTLLYCHWILLESECQK